MPMPTSKGKDNQVENYAEGYCKENEQFPPGFLRTRKETI